MLCKRKPCYNSKDVAIGFRTHPTGTDRLYLSTLDRISSRVKIYTVRKHTLIVIKNFNITRMSILSFMYQTRIISEVLQRLREMETHDLVIYNDVGCVHPESD